MRACVRHVGSCLLGLAARYEYDHRYSVTFNRKDAGKALEKFLSSFDIPVCACVCVFMHLRVLVCWCERLGVGTDCSAFLAVPCCSVHTTDTALVEVAERLHLGDGAGFAGRGVQHEDDSVVCHQSVHWPGVWSGKGVPATHAGPAMT